MLRGCWQCGADVCVSVQIDSSSSFLSTHATNQISVGAHGGAQKDHQYTFDHVMGTGATQQDVYGASLAPMVGTFLQGYNTTCLGREQPATNPSLCTDCCARSIRPDGLGQNVHHGHELRRRLRRRRLPRHQPSLPRRPLSEHPRGRAGGRGRVVPLRAAHPHLRVSVSTNTCCIRFNLLGPAWRRLQWRIANLRMGFSLTHLELAAT